MKKELWLLIFIIALCADIGFILSDHTSFRVISKPLIVFSLLIYFISKTSGTNPPIKYLIIGALFFSLAGDVLLLFEVNDPLFFVTGLIAFLIAHIFYIVAFNKIRSKAGIRFKLLVVLPVIVYYLTLIAILFNHLNEMMIPVIVYGFTISLMLAMAIHLIFINNKQVGALLFTGALLFILSDSILAFNKFYTQWVSATVMIMISYGLAQLFITYSMAKLLEEDGKEANPIFVHSQMT